MIKKRSLKQPSPRTGFFLYGIKPYKEVNRFKCPTLPLCFKGKIFSVMRLFVAVDASIPYISDKCTEISVGGYTGVQRDDLAVKINVQHTTLQHSHQLRLNWPVPLPWFVDLNLSKACHKMLLFVAVSAVSLQYPLPTEHPAHPPGFLLITLRVVVFILLLYTTSWPLCEVAVKHPS